MNTRSLTLRTRFTAVSFTVAIALLAWGAFVTSINAGMAVPDWPTSFNSYDPFNPWPDWWTVTPVLAEHGHRLLGALVGFLTLILAGWTWVADPRQWMRWTAVSALVLVVGQGVLGGLRVLYVSLDLAVVHACVAQLFFATLACMIVFTSRAWRTAPPGLGTATVDADNRLAQLRFLVPLAVYIQIIFGALLRHPGTGIDTALVILHLSWAFVAAAAVVGLWSVVRAAFAPGVPVRRLANAMASLLAFQVALGIFAYFVLLDEQGMVMPSNVQVLTNSAHMVTGALLFASTVATSVLSSRTQFLSRSAS